MITVSLFLNQYVVFDGKYVLGRYSNLIDAQKAYPKAIHVIKALRHEHYPYPLFYKYVLGGE